jgi:hypothetical protein
MFESSQERIQRETIAYQQRVKKQNALEQQQTSAFDRYTNPAPGLDQHLRGCNHIRNCDCTPDKVRYAFDQTILTSAVKKADLTVLHLGAGDMQQVFSSSYALLSDPTIKSVHAIAIEPLLLKSDDSSIWMDSDQLINEMETVVTRINQEKAPNPQKGNMLNHYTPANGSSIPLRISRFTTVFSFYLACHPERVQIMENRDRFNSELALFEKQYPHHRPTKFSEYTQDMMYSGCQMDQKNNAAIINDNTKKVSLRVDMAVSIDLQAHTETNVILGDCFNGIRAAQTLLLGEAQPLKIISCQQEVTLLSQDQYCEYYNASSIKRESDFPVETKAASVPIAHKTSNDSCCMM